MKSLLLVTAVSCALVAGCGTMATAGTVTAVPAGGIQSEASKVPKPSGSKPPPGSFQPTTLEALKNPASKATSGVTDLRRQLLTSTAKTLGFRGGVAARAHDLSAALRGRSEDLDRIFQFSTLIAPGGTLPPVIVEARDLATFAPDQIRTATRAYKIEREERFVSVPPTWRDYLFVGLDLRQEVELPAFEARPQDRNEQALWNTAVQSGWEQGQKEAERILGANFKRLTRDYAGMLLYSTLLQQGMITNTRVAESQLAVSGNRKELTLGDSLKRVTERASFETNPNNWTPSVNKGKPEDKSITAGREPAAKAKRRGQ